MWQHVGMSKNRAKERERRRLVAKIEALLHKAQALVEKGKHERAVALLEQGTKRFGGQASLYNSIGIARHHQGKYKLAIRAYKKSISAFSDNPGAWSNLGASHAAMAHHAEAIAAYRRALELDDTNVGAWNNLGVVFLDSDRSAQAIPAFERAIRHAPGESKAYFHLGEAYELAGSVEQAIPGFARATELDPTQAKHHGRLASALSKVKRDDEAVRAFEAGLALHAADADLHYLRAEHHRARGEGDQAAQWYAHTLELDPQHHSARHMLAAQTGTQSDARSRRLSTTSLFDDYARRFDRHLVEVLQYRGPQQLFDAVDALSIAPGPVIDLGCGTGLCGPLFKSLATEMVGVDLSNEMIEMARLRQVYDELVVGDLVEALADRSGFGLAIAADVLIYVGEVEPLLAALASTLKPGGLFAFSVETPTDPSAACALQSTGRYAHSDSYVRRVAAEHGFAERVCRDVPLRLDADNFRVWVLERVR